MTWKRKKIREVKSAKELLRIDSSYKKVQRSKRNLLIGIIAFFIIIYLSIILFFINKEIKSEQLAIVISILFIFILIVFIINKSNQRRGSTFLITEKGILLEPDIAEYWMDIKGYEWETFKCFSKLTVSGKGKGMCLIILNKGFSQRNILRWSWHSLLTQHGIFFSPEQVKETEKIFSKFGINKTYDDK
jgi:energy-coupling factor transporter transmembrane protein EcfT